MKSFLSSIVICLALGMLSNVQAATLGDRYATGTSPYSTDSSSYSESTYTESGLLGLRDGRENHYYNQQGRRPTCSGAGHCVHVNQGTIYRPEERGTYRCRTRNSQGLGTDVCQVDSVSVLDVSCRGRQGGYAKVFFGQEWSYFEAHGPIRARWGSQVRGHRAPYGNAHSTNVANDDLYVEC